MPTNTEIVAAIVSTRNLLKAIEQRQKHDPDFLGSRDEAHMVLMTLVRQVVRSEAPAARRAKLLELAAVATWAAIAQWD